MTAAGDEMIPDEDVAISCLEDKTPLCNVPELDPLNERKKNHTLNLQNTDVNLTDTR